MIPSAPAPVQPGVVGSQPVVGNGVLPAAAPVITVGSIAGHAPGVSVQAATAAAAAPTNVHASTPTPAGAQDFSINPVTGKSTTPTGPAVIPPGATITNTFTAVKAKDFEPGKDTGLVKATVTSVEDGDGAYLKTTGAGKALTCRFGSIDAPEVAHPNAGKPGQPYGEESKAALQKMILNKEVQVNVTLAQDKYGRSICQIELAGKNINRQMLLDGAAWVNETYNKNPEDIAAFHQARDLKKGLFAQPNPETPWDFRRRIR